VQLKELYYAGSHGMDIAGPTVSKHSTAAEAQMGWTRCTGRGIDVALGVRRSRMGVDVWLQLWSGVARLVTCARSMGTGSLTEGQ
jgi:hypothetical protein